MDGFCWEHRLWNLSVLFLARDFRDFRDFRNQWSIQQFCGLHGISYSTKGWDPSFYPRVSWCQTMTHTPRICQSDKPRFHRNWNPHRIKQNPIVVEAYNSITMRDSENTSEALGISGADVHQGFRQPPAIDPCAVAPEFVLANACTASRWSSWLSLPWAERGIYGYGIIQPYSVYNTKTYRNI